MSDAVRNELFVFGISILTGVIAGIIFDFFRAVRRCGMGRGGAVVLCDIFFWIGEAALVFAAAYNFNSGQIRFYIFIGIAMGIMLYLLTLSRIVLRILVWIYSALIFFCSKIKVLILFLLKPVLFLMRKIVYVSKNIRTRGKKLKKQLKMY